MFEKNPQKAKLESGPNTFNPEDFILIQPTKPMTVGEVLAEAERQGARPISLEELETFIKMQQEVTIEPRSTDIEGEFKEMKD